jgi:competence protein ComEC
VRSVLLLAGILLALWLPAPAQGGLAWCLGALLPLVLCWRRARILLPALFGAACALLISARVTALPPLEPGERVIVAAQVEGIPALDDSGWQFDAAITFPRQPQWPAQRWRITLPASMDAPAPGELWQYALRFDPPRDARERRLLLRDHIAAQARMVEGPLNERIAPATSGLAALRAYLARRISERVADPSAAALLAALAVGATGEVSTRQWQVFNATGITHLVAISGMHVTFFAMLSMAAARRVWPWLSALPCAPRRELFAAAVGIVLALLYALLSGFSVPAQRTVVMLAAFLMARESGRCCTGAWSISVAMAAVLLFDPLAALSAGFWLSFLAVAAIVLLAGARLTPGAPLGAAVRVQWLVSIALLPVTVAIFGTFSAVGLLANALAIPVFTLLLVPPILLATACYLLPGSVPGWCGDLLVDLTGWVAAALWPFLTWCAGLPGALWQAQVPLGWYLAAVPAVALALLPAALGLRGVGLLVLVCAFLLRSPRPPAGELWIDVPAAGSSIAAVLRTGEHLLIWGSGESFGARGRAFSRHLLPLLRSSGYGVVDLWLPGNLTRDVQMAVTSGAAKLQIERVMLPPARGVPPEMQPCSDTQWQWNEVRFTLAASTDGRECLLVADVNGQVLRLGGEDATPLDVKPGTILRLVMDPSGIRQRPRHLRL